MHIGQLRGSFLSSALNNISLATELGVIVNADKIHESIRSWMMDENLIMSGIGLDLLMRKKVWEDQARKELRTRRDGITPDYPHELRIALSIIADYNANLIPRQFLEPLLTLAFIHDLGEDFNILPDPMASFFHKHARGHNLNKLPDVEELMLDMERLTFDRKYTDVQICQEIRLKKDSLNLEKDEPLPREILEIFLAQLQSKSGTVSGFLPPLKILPQQDGKGRYIVSRHIENGILDWNLYMRAVGTSSLASLVKMKDRGDGLGTRIGKKFDIIAYSDYLSKSFQTFSLENFGRTMADKHLSLRDTFLSTDKMLGALHRIGRLYVTVHPSRNIQGSKGYNIETIEPIDFRDYFPGALTGYKNIPAGAMPLNIILNRIRYDPDLDKKGEILHKKIITSIDHAQNGGRRYPETPRQSEFHF